MLGIDGLQHAGRVATLDAQAAFGAARGQAAAGCQRLQHRHAALEAQRTRTLYFTVDVEAWRAFDVQHVAAHQGHVAAGVAAAHQGHHVQHLLAFGTALLVHQGDGFAAIGRGAAGQGQHVQHGAGGVDRVTARAVHLAQHRYLLAYHIGHQDVHLRLLDETTGFQQARQFLFGGSRRQAGDFHLADQRVADGAGVADAGFHRQVGVVIDRNLEDVAGAQQQVGRIRGVHPERQQGGRDPLCISFHSSRDAARIDVVAFGCGRCCRCGGRRGRRCGGVRRQALVQVLDLAGGAQAGQFGSGRFLVARIDQELLDLRRGGGQVDRRRTGVGQHAQHAALAFTQDEQLSRLHGDQALAQRFGQIGAGARHLRALVLGAALVEPDRHFVDRLGRFDGLARFGIEVLGGHDQLAQFELLAGAEEQRMLVVVGADLFGGGTAGGQTLLHVRLGQDQRLGALDGLHHFRITVEFFFLRGVDQQLALDQALQQLLAPRFLLGSRDIGALQFFVELHGSDFFAAHAHQRLARRRVFLAAASGQRGRHQQCADGTLNWRSEGIFALEHHQHGAHDDPHIEPQRPVAQVIEVVGDARFHLVERVGFATQAVHLGPAGDARLDLVTQHVTLDQLAILFVVRDRMRTRTDYAHASLQHVDELRQLVKRRLAQEPADLGHALVVLGGLHHLGAVLGHRHRAELVDHDFFAIQAVAALAEDDRPLGRGLDGDGNHRHDGQQHDLDQRGQHDVADPLEQTVKAGERRFADGNHGHAADVVEARLHQVEDIDIGQEVHRRGGVLQLVDQAADARLGRDRLADEHQLDLVLAHVIGNLVHLAQHRVRQVGRPAVLRPVVEVTDHLHVHIGIAVDIGGKAGAGGVGADQDHRAHLGAVGTAQHAGGAVRPQQQQRHHAEPHQHHALVELADHARAHAQQRQDQDGKHPAQQQVARIDVHFTGAPGAVRIDELVHRRHDEEDQHHQDQRIAVERPAVGEGTQVQRPHDQDGVEYALEDRNKGNIVDGHNDLKLRGDCERIAIGLVVAGPGRNTAVAFFLEGAGREQPAWREGVRQGGGRGARVILEIAVGQLLLLGARQESVEIATLALHVGLEADLRRHVPGTADRHTFVERTVDPRALDGGELLPDLGVELEALARRPVDHGTAVGAAGVAGGVGVVLALHPAAEEQQLGGAGDGPEQVDLLLVLLVAVVHDVSDALAAQLQADAHARRRQIVELDHRHAFGALVIALGFQAVAVFVLAVAGHHLVARVEAPGAVHVIAATRAQIALVVVEIVEWRKRIGVQRAQVAADVVAQTPGQVGVAFLAGIVELAETVELDARGPQRCGQVLATECLVDAEAGCCSAVIVAAVAAEFGQLVVRQAQQIAVMQITEADKRRKSVAFGRHDRQAVRAADEGGAQRFGPTHAARHQGREAGRQSVQHS
uniref:Uncharacterized protein n=1 Tax=Tanacetum cinerariifolium TaxID=118510 RepID=A0A699GDJ4_TANCI|nr:hypothetical protein [Tanacetum cinerariifolium]